MPWAAPRSRGALGLSALRKCLLHQHAKVSEAANRAPHPVPSHWGDMWRNRSDDDIQLVMDLAAFNNATMHISGGSMGAEQYLGKHSRTISSDWFHYLAVPPECGQGPFNEVESFEGCRDITDRGFDFSQPLFSGKNGCVRVLTKWIYMRWGETVPSQPRCHLRVSGDIRERALQVLKEQGFPERFGAAHIRRCDALNKPMLPLTKFTAKCTAPDVVASVIGSITDVDAWMIFTYAETGYSDMLKALLKCPSCNRTIVFEDTMKLNPKDDGDNFYSYLVGQTILEMAATRVNARKCAGAIPNVSHPTREAGLLGLSYSGPDIMEEDAEAFGEDSELFGLCYGKPETRAALA
eukprot:CAMPEP_0171188830 /NCGR_PEP_ID=MMETSP0790-20130122/18035_1 /TAXON_ID=2925 /ORGANISM="Alexandrium catenella, Strain OF101" /LENGTH=350 /DNA_ID=CAMNT_0011653927 /DNA_START=77 /DNA_END=1130 /DNA_ORIENTATION=-